ncbi:hypothetical protein HP388_00120, partial [Escherichia coli]|uniref:hypothetical protein n=1 Tax=Escherichia coli TaxID=562 RepID=UPI0015C53224
MGRQHDPAVPLGVGGWSKRDGDLPVGSGRMAAWRVAGGAARMGGNQRRPGCQCAPVAGLGSRCTSQDTHRDNSPVGRVHG